MSIAEHFNCQKNASVLPVSVSWICDNFGSSTEAISLTVYFGSKFFRTEQMQFKGPDPRP